MRMAHSSQLTGEAYPDVTQCLHGLGGLLAAPQHGSGQALGQVGQLVLHEGYQGRHNKHQPPTQQCWHLVAQ